MTSPPKSFSVWRALQIHFLCGKVFKTILRVINFQKGSLKVTVRLLLLYWEVKWHLKVFSRSFNCYFQKGSLKVTVWLLLLDWEVKWHLKVFSCSLNCYFQKRITIKVKVGLLLLKTEVKWELKVFSRSLNCYFQKGSPKVTVWLLLLDWEVIWQNEVFRPSKPKRMPCCANLVGTCERKVI